MAKLSGKLLNNLGSKVRNVKFCHIAVRRGHEKNQCYAIPLCSLVNFAQERRA